MTSGKSTLKKAVLTAVFAALITVMTAFVCHIPYGINGGYVHFGDALIYLSAAILPTPYAIFAAAVGGGLADLLTAPVWAIFTVVVKSLLVLPMTSKKPTVINRRNIIGLVIGAFTTVLGYYLSGAIIAGDFISPAYSILGNVIQSVGSAIIFILIGAALDKSGFKKYAQNMLG